MEEGSICPVCFTGALLLHSGMLVCEVCGTTMQVGGLITTIRWSNGFYEYPFSCVLDLAPLITN